MSLFRGLIPLSLMVAAGCAANSVGSGGSMDATVRYLKVSGGCWAIETSDGTRFEPIGLPPEFRHDGKKVRVELKPRGDLASTCMVGKIANIISIKPR